MAKKTAPQKKKKENVFSVFDLAKKLKARKKAQQDLYDRLGVEVIGDK